jgi:hypothetical protein
MRNFLASAFLLVCLVPALFGQAFSSLSGTVTDPTGGVIPGAAISVTNTQTGITRETISNDEGRYSFPQIPPGTYQMTAKTPGFSDVAIKDVQLLVNSPATVNVKFEKLGAVSETVNVEAAASAPTVRVPPAPGKLDGQGLSCSGSK